MESSDGLELGNDSVHVEHISYDVINLGDSIVKGMGVLNGSVTGQKWTLMEISKGRRGRIKVYIRKGDRR